MKPLKETYWIFGLLSICPLIESMDRWKKMLKIWILILYVAGLFLLLIASLAFVKQSYSTDLTSAISTCFQISGSISTLYSLITAHIKRKVLKNIFDEFQTFYDASKFNHFQKL